MTLLETYSPFQNAMKFIKMIGALDGNENITDLSAD
jgi:hypothetical protein